MRGRSTDTFKGIQSLRYPGTSADDLSLVGARPARRAVAVQTGPARQAPRIFQRGQPVGGCFLSVIFAVHARLTRAGGDTKGRTFCFEHGSLECQHLNDIFVFRTLFE